MTDPTGMSPFTGSGFRSGKARTSERRCWDCRKPMDTTTKLVRCGHCHDQRMAAIAERRASLSPPGVHTDVGTRQPAPIEVEQ